MKTYEKTYIGKGKKVQNLDIMKISFKLSEILKLTHEYEGEDYLTFEVAKMKQADKFSNEYTAYVNKLIETPQLASSQVNDPAPKKTRKSRKEKTTLDGKIIADQIPCGDFPF